MEREIQTIVDDLPGEIMAIFDYNQEKTGFDGDTVLLQSLYLHYPKLYLRVPRSLQYFFLIDNQHYDLLDSLVEFNGGSIFSTIMDLFGIDDSPQYVPSEFPTYSQLQSLLQSSPLFSDFSPDIRVAVLLEKLIMRYHLMIQPEEIVAKTIREKGNDYYNVVFLDLPASVAVSLLKSCNFTIYQVRRPDYEIISRVEKMVTAISSLYL